MCGGVGVVCGGVVCGDGRVGRTQLLMSVLSGLHLDWLLWDSVRFCVCRHNDVHCMHRSVCLWDAKEKACLRHRALPPCYRSLKVFERWSRSVSLLALSGQCTDILLLNSSTLAVSHAPWQGGASGGISSWHACGCSPHAISDIISTPFQIVYVLKSDHAPNWAGHVCFLPNVEHRDALLAVTADGVIKVWCLPSTRLPSVSEGGAID